MREQEMRMRVFRFLKARMRNMIMPATVGIGLAVGGCAKEGLHASDAAAFRDSGGIPIYSAVFPGPDSASPSQTDVLPGRDADVPTTDGSAPSPDLAGRDTPVNGSDMAPPKDANGPDTSERDAVAPNDQAVALDSGARDSGADLGGIFTKYIAPIPDAAPDSTTVVPMYSAITPDAAPGPDSMVVRYMAPILDAARDVGLTTLYMAPQPS